MTPFWPTPAEAASLRFLLPLGNLITRVAVAACLFAVGLAFWGVAPVLVAPVGLVLILAGHLALWVRTQTTAPGGATPAHEEVWSPVEDDWMARVEALEKDGARWDVTPWDVSNGLGCVTLLSLVAAVGAAAYIALGPLGFGGAVRLAVAGLALFVPLWVNGMRTTWNPSELRKKGDALEIARAAAQGLVAGDFDFVPTLALREGRRGKYPVDARLMLRPSREDGSGFLGIQLQVAINSVQGTDYPYLYAVVLGKDGFRLPSVSQRRDENDVDTVFETGQGQGARYIVIRQHADRSGGWHTKPEHIRGLVATAVETARAAWRANGGKPSR